MKVEVTVPAEFQGERLPTAFAAGAVVRVRQQTCPAASGCAPASLQARSLALALCCGRRDGDGRPEPAQGRHHGQHHAGRRRRHPRRRAAQPNVWLLDRAALQHPGERPSARLGRAHARRCACVLRACRGMQHFSRRLCCVRAARDLARVQGKGEFSMEYSHHAAVSREIQVRRTGRVLLSRGRTSAGAVAQGKSALAHTLERVCRTSSRRASPSTPRRPRREPRTPAHGTWTGGTVDAAHRRFSSAQGQQDDACTHTYCFRVRRRAPLPAPRSRGPFDGLMLVRHHARGVRVSEVSCCLSASEWETKWPRVGSMP